MKATVSGIFRSEEEAIAAINDLMASGVDKERISVLAKDDDKAGTVSGKTQVEEQRAASEEAFGILSGFLTGIGGGFIVPGLVAPGIGPLVAAGPLASMFSGESERDLEDLLVSLGYEREDAKHFAGEFDRGRVLVLVEE